MAATVLPVNFDLRVYRGDDYFVGFAYDETDSETGDSIITDLTGWSALLQVRSLPGGSVWLALSDGDGITLALGAEGGIEAAVWITAATTADDAWANKQAGSWDIQFTSPTGIVTTPFAGRFALVQDIARTAGTPA